DVPNVPFDEPAGPVVLTRATGLSNQAFAWILSDVPSGTGIELSKVDRASGHPVGRISTRGCGPPTPCVVAVDDGVWLTVSSARPGVVEPGISVEGIDVTGKDDTVVIPASSKT